MNKETKCTNCNCKANYLKFVPRILTATFIIFLFYLVLSAIWYHFIFGEIWFKTIISSKIEMSRPSTNRMILMLLGNLLGAFITANIFFIYLKRIAIARLDKECKVHWCMVIPVIVLLSGFYFFSSALNLVFNVYTISHLFIETGYLFISLTFSGIIVVKLLKKKFEEIK